MTNSLTIKAKLFLLALLGVSFAVLVGASGYWGQAAQSTALDEVVTNSIALRNHMEADMEHEGILADVLAALRAGAATPPQPEQIAAIAKEFVRHADIMRKGISDNQKLVLDEAIQKQMRVVNPALDSYIEKANTIIDRAAKDIQSAQADFPDFKARFDVLEKEQDTLSNLI